MNITHRRRSNKIQWWKVRQKIHQRFHRNWKIIYWVTLVLVWIGWIGWAIYWFLFSESFKVQSVTIAIQWPAIKENDELKATIKKWITNSSIIYQRLHLWSYLSNMKQSDYPIISWWTVNRSWWNNLYLSIKLKQPDFVYSVNWTRRFVVQEKPYRVIWSDNFPTLVIWWASWNTLSWMFYIIDQQRLEKQLKIITNSVQWYSEIAYYPGWGRIRLNIKWAFLRVDITSNVYQQIRNIREYVSRNQLQRGQIIDAGSVPNFIFTTNPKTRSWG